MRYRIVSNRGLLAETDLDGVDLGMGSASGTFVPTEAYLEVEELFLAKVRAMDVDNTALERCGERELALELRVENRNGIDLAAIDVDLGDFTAEVGEDDSSRFHITVRFADIRVLDAEHLQAARDAEEAWSRE